MEVNGVTCIKGEIHSLMTLMRLNTRWAAPSRFSRELLIQDESPLIQSFRRLNEYLEDTYDLRDVDCVVYLDPFLQVVISEHASGPLTSAALSSLNKFALYGFLACDLPRSNEGINLTAHCISTCVFEETDWESDEIILVKLLELSSTCLRCEASMMLTVSSAWDIFSTCLSIHGQYRASKLLRSEAETALRHLTLTAFSRAESVVRVLPPSSLLNNGTRGADTFGEDGEHNESVDNVIQASTIGELTISSTAGLTFYLRKIMSVLSEIMDPQTQSPEQVKFALTLVNIALEAGGPSLGSLPALVDILRGDVCRHLLRTSQSEDMDIFSLALRVVFNLFVSIKDHMKVQLEVFLTSVHLRLLNSSSLAASASSAAMIAAATAAANTNSAHKGAILSLAKEELALESLLEFCREPSLMHDLYTNYDCDVQCTNLFDSIMSTLCARSKPSGTQAYYQVNCDHRRKEPGSGSTASVDKATSVRYVNILNRLSFEGVLLILHSVAVRCWAAARYKANSGFAKKRSNSNLGRGLATSPVKQANIISDQYGLRIDASMAELEESSALNSPSSAASSDLSSAVSQQRRNRKLDAHSVPPGRMGGRFLDRSTSVSSADHNDFNEDDHDLTSDPDNEDEDETDFLLMARAKTAEVLRQRKIKKQKIRLVAEKFNESPFSGEWIRFASDLGLLPKIPPSAVEGKGGANLVDAKSLARFLKSTAGLDKAKVGEFLSKGPKELYKYHSEVLHEYVATFEFISKGKGKGKAGIFVKALRAFLGQFRLPGEAQCIDRLMEAFADRLFDQLGANNPFVSADGAFILAFSTIMLNTDLHNPGIPDKKRMKKEDFIRNNRGINGGTDLPQEYLETLYDEIRTRQIQVDLGIADPSNAHNLDMISDTQHWDKLIKRADADQTPASFTPTVTARRYKGGNYNRNGGVTLFGVDEFDESCLHTVDNHYGVADGPINGDPSLSTMYPGSVHDGDMFLVMASPALDALQLLWETTEDPQLLCKIVEGIWDYASICAVLKLSEEFNSLIRLLADKVRTLLENGAEDALLDLMNNTRKTDVFDSLETTGKVDTIKANMKKLLRADFETILHSRKKNAHRQMYQLVDRHRIQHLKRGPASAQEAPIDDISSELPNIRIQSSQSEKIDPDEILWEGAQYIRGQILMRTLFHICNKYIALIGPTGWTSLIRLLLWCRRHGDLPDNLVEIDDFSDARGGSLEPSIYAVRCREGNVKSRKSGESPPGSGGGSIWSSVTSLGGLLWQPSGPESGNALDNINGAKGNQNFIATSAPIYNHHPLLKSTLTACRVDALLFMRIRDLSESSLISTVSCMIDELEGIYRFDSFETVKDQLKDSDHWESTDGVSSNKIVVSANISSTNEFVVGDFPRVMSELDGVVVIEWVSRLMFANMHRAKAIWTRLHEFFASILERHVEEATRHCPYLLERCLVAIVRAAIHLLHFSVPMCDISPTAVGCDSSMIGQVSEQSTSQVSAGVDSPEDVDLVHGIWQSLRLLKGVPSDVISNLSDRLGAGLLTFIRGSPECSTIRTLEHWYLLFSLLSAISAGREGRPYVWEAVGYLIDNNLINNTNFTPCRHLVLRFLYRVFPGEMDEEARLQQGLPQASERNPWLTGSLVHLLRLALMACAGYSKSNSLALRAAPNSKDGMSKQRDALQYMTFLFEDNDESSFSTGLSYVASPSRDFQSASTAGNIDGSKVSSGKNSSGPGKTISVVSVCFSQKEEVQLLLVETVKTFSDFVSVTPLAVSKHAAFCLSVLLSSFKKVSLHQHVWTSVLREMINRLPLNFTNTLHKFQSRCENAEEIDSLCLKSCNLVFGAMTINFRILRELSEFQNLWLSFLSLLALNINDISELRNKQNLQTEFIEMSVALLRFLVPGTVKKSSIGNMHSYVVVLQSENKSLHRSSGPESNLGSYSAAYAMADVQLLHLTWNSILGVCPIMPSCLKKNHSYMLEILNRSPGDYVFQTESDIANPGTNARAPDNSESNNQIFAKTSAASPSTIKADVSSNSARSLDRMKLSTNTTTAGDNQLQRPSSMSSISDNAANNFPIADGSALPNDSTDPSRIRKIDARTHIV